MCSIINPKDVNSLADLRGRPQNVKIYIFIFIGPLFSVSDLSFLPLCLLLTTVVSYLRVLLDSPMKMETRGSNKIFT